MQRICLILALQFFCLCPLVEAANFAQYTQKMMCAPEVSKVIGTNLLKKKWIPTAFFEGPGLEEGFRFRDSKAARAYTIWSETDSITFAVEDISKKSETLTTWKKNNCIPVLTNRIAQYPTFPANGFQDKDLQALLVKNSRGLIYIWSPYMPLSIEGLKVIKGVSKNLKMPLTVLVDGKAYPKDIEAWKVKGSIATSDVNICHSSELFIRGTGLHYPILFIYKNEFLSNTTFVGFKKSSNFQDWIKKQILDIKSESAQ